MPQAAQELTAKAQEPARPRWERGAMLRETCLGEVYAGTDRLTGKAVCIKRADRECVAHEYEVTFTERKHGGFGLRMKGPCVTAVDPSSPAEKMVLERKLICGSAILAVNG